MQGAAEVEVEHRAGPQESFGRGRKRRMRFGDALRAASRGDASLYLTTQDAPTAPDGHPELLTPPLAHLAADFPPRPALLGNLVPQSLNLWVGSAPQAHGGASSGLHHDFHDNLYVLLRGRKRFRLFPPSLAGAMYTHGTPLRVYPNGRIVYQGQGAIDPDGSDPGEVARWRAKRAAEAELAAAEAAAAAGARVSGWGRGAVLPCLARRVLGCTAQGPDCSGCTPTAEPAPVQGSKARLARAERAFDALLEAALGRDFDCNDFDDLRGGGPEAGGLTMGIVARTFWWPRAQPKWRRRGCRTHALAGGSAP